MAKVPPEDYIILKDAAEMTRRAWLEMWSPGASRWVLEAGKTKEGIHYPKRMMYANTARRRSTSYVKVIEVQSFTLMPSTALADWEIPAGTLVRNAITDTLYKQGISPDRYMDEAAKQVEQIRAFQRGEVELPELLEGDAARPARAAESNEGGD